MILFLILAVCALAALPSSIHQRAHFEVWKHKNNKVYASAAEEDIRFANFVASKERIARLNARKGATYGLNKFSDLSPQEFRDRYLLKNPIQPQTAGREYIKVDRSQALPQTYDWRQHGGVTPVKDQEQCGSCWAFSTTENIESVVIIQQNRSQLQPLSPQQIVDCDNSDGGCNGGDPPTAYEYVISAGGMETNTAYPYTGQDGTCAFDKTKVIASIKSWKYACNYYQEDTLRGVLVNYAPPSICVDAANWQDYQSGIMTAWECAWINTLDHCVQAVGYDMTGSMPFWIVRNSWGTSWGEQGYIRLQYGDNTCGLTTEASTSTV